MMSTRSPLPPGADSPNKRSLLDLSKSDKEVGSRSDKVREERTQSHQHWASKRVITYEEASAPMKARNSIAEDRPVSRKEVVAAEMRENAEDRDHDVGADANLETATEEQASAEGATKT